MKETSRSLRMVENEVIFRERNEQLQKGIDMLNEMAQQDGQPDEAYLDTQDLPLHFFCECSDEKCTKRIMVKHSDYKEIHKNRKRFVVVKGHQVASIERVIKENTDYMIIEKNIDPPKHTSGELNATELSNA